MANIMNAEWLLKRMWAHMVSSAMSDSTICIVQIYISSTNNLVGQQGNDGKHY